MSPRPLSAVTTPAITLAGYHSGTVFSQQGVYFTRPEVHRNVVERLRPAEAFADPAHRKQDLGTKDHVDLIPFDWFKDDVK